MERYNRHHIISNFGVQGQEKLTHGKVLIVGAGGLGCPVIQYLAAAGVGEISIVDADVVSESNLQRQILYTESEIGISKSQLAAEKMKKLNSHIQINHHTCFLDEALADKLFPNYDVVIGATDNYHSRYLIDKKSKQHNIPFIHGSINEFEGQLCVFNYKGSLSYTDLFGNQPEEPKSPVGVLGALPGIIGSIMAMETIKILTESGKVHCNKLLIYNALENSFRQFSF